jgi:hypothetical protein
MSYDCLSECDASFRRDSYAMIAVLQHDKRFSCRGVVLDFLDQFTSALKYGLSVSCEIKQTHRPVCFENC